MTKIASGWVMLHPFHIALNANQSERTGKMPLEADPKPMKVADSPNPSMDSDATEPKQEIPTGQIARKAAPEASSLDEGESVNRHQTGERLPGCEFTRLPKLNKRQLYGMYCNKLPLTH